MADVTDLRRRVVDYAREVQRDAVERVVVQLDRRQPHISERLARDVTRTESEVGDRISTRLVQGSGGGERPTFLPEALDEGRQYVIRPRTRRFLRFEVAGRVVFARQVLWNRYQRSRGFWSETVNQDGWERALEESANNRPLPP